MERDVTNTLVQQLAVGFETLQDEYHKLHVQHQALERKLATARDQYNEVVRLYGSGATNTPPLSLTSTPGKRDQAEAIRTSAADILEEATDPTSRSAAIEVRTAAQALPQIRKSLDKSRQSSSHGVKIWSGRSADRLEASSSLMPSISESPLEQDFTIEGLPSKLGCPFASMANKKLSSHAASVLSRYNNNSAAGTPTSPSLVSANRINGRDSLEARRSSGRRESFVDPIKAEICGLSDHEEDAIASEPAVKFDKAEVKAQQKPEMEDEHDQPAAAEPGVCPIRFLDQHSPEEVATYFERHKHELPRSHENCVKRYQSNEQQIRELDAKYGNLVSMISGLGAKHKDMLPEEPEEGEGEQNPAEIEKIRKWASSVSVTGKDVVPEEVGGKSGEQRQSHFERPLREVRVGESPSRPWGITVPAKYVEAAVSEGSTDPVQVASKPAEATKCPFGYSKPAATNPEPSRQATAQPVFLGPEATAHELSPNAVERSAEAPDAKRGMVLTGPVFIGYSAEDAVRILRESGLANR